MTAPSNSIVVEISPGELLDRISILRIKAARVSHPQKLANVRRELTLLETARRAVMPESAAVAATEAELTAVNEQLWEGEDAIRALDRDEDFGPGFIEVARSICRLNDRRAQLKLRINQILDSRWTDEKVYTAYE